MAARIAITISSVDRQSLIDALNVLAFANRLWLARNQHTAPLYSSRVLFRPEPFEGSGVELYQTIPEVLAQGFGDCDDLAGWRCAELLNSGVRAECDLLSLGPRTHHAVVRYAGRVEDPAHIIKRMEAQRWYSDR